MMKGQRVSSLTFRANAPGRRLIGDSPALDHGSVRRAQAALLDYVERSRNPMLNQTDKAVFRALLWRRFSCRTLQCWPSKDTLAADVGRSVSVVARSVAVLVRLGLITKARRMSQSGRMSNAYGFNFGLVGFGSIYAEPVGDAWIKPRRSRPSRNADGTFASGTGPESDLQGEQAAMAEPAQGESEAATLGGPLAVAAALPLALSPRALAVLDRGRLAPIAPLPARQSSVFELVSRLDGQRKGRLP